jgi:curli biogenesis system outer membrane secretion channel CsgG
VTARLTLLVAAGAAVVALCTGCQGTTGSSPAPPANNYGQQLDQLQSTLDSVQSQINSDATP